MTKGLQRFFVTCLVSFSLFFGVQSVLADASSLAPKAFESGDVLTDTHHIFLPMFQTSGTALPWQPNDPYYSSQWAMEKTGAPTAWQSADGAGVLLAVLDSGVDFDHVDLTNKVRRDLDWDFVNDDDDAQDDYGHGTHVSGIAAAAPNNGEGVVGVGWDVEILPLKVLNEEGHGSMSDVIAAIYYATDAGADIINMSFNTSADSPMQCTQLPALVEALEYAYQHGVLLIAAAGNKGIDAAQVAPANCPYVLTVAATTSDDGIASFSNYGEVVDVAAPGWSIYSTFLGNTYRVKSGTSMAAPFVAGVAALVWSRYPDYTPDFVAAAILNTAQDLGGNGWDPAFGCGRVAAAAAVTVEDSHPTPCRDQTSLAILSPLEENALPQELSLQDVVATDGMTRRVIVRLRDVNTVTSGALSGASVQILRENWAVITVPSDAQSLVQQWLTDGEIVSAQLDYSISVE